MLRLQDLQSSMTFTINNPDLQVDLYSLDICLYLSTGYEILRDLLRRRMHLMRKRAELLCHIHNINCHEADLVFGRGLPHNETWVENAQPRILISYKFFHINTQYNYDRIFKNLRYKSNRMLGENWV